MRAEIYETENKKTEEKKQRNQELTDLKEVL